MTKVENDTSESLFDNGLPPPGKKQKLIKQPLKLIFELLYAQIIYIPTVMWCIIKSLLFLRRKSVRGKVVLVTGSGRGLGEGLARKFAKLGAKVACADIDEKLNQEAVREINKTYPSSAIAYKCNVTSPKDIKRMKEQVKRDLGDVNILVHNAGIIDATSITDFDDIQLDNVLAVNVKSHFYLIREFLPDMISRNEGHIAAISSMSAFAGLANASAYSATKHAVVGIMDSLNQELQTIPNNQIKTTLICPYFINTSEFYTGFWNLRIRPMSIKTAVEASVDGLLREKRIFCVPLIMYSLLLCAKFMPNYLNDMYRKIFYAKISIPTRSVREQTPVFHLLNETAETIQTRY